MMAHPGPVGLQRDAMRDLPAQPLSSDVICVMLTGMGGLSCAANATILRVRWWTGAGSCLPRFFNSLCGE